MFQVKDLSIYQWFNRFEVNGVAGLPNRSGKGRKPLLKLTNQAHLEVVTSSIEKQAQRLKVAKAAIEKQLGCSLSESTLKRFLKNLVTAGNAFGNG
jgi:transposase